MRNAIGLIQASSDRRTRRDPAPSAARTVAPLSLQLRRAARVWRTALPILGRHATPRLAAQRRVTGPAAAAPPRPAGGPVADAGTSAMVRREMLLAR